MNRELAKDQPSPAYPIPELAEIGRAVESVARRLRTRGRTGEARLSCLEDALELGAIDPPGALRELPLETAWIVLELASACLPAVHRLIIAKEPN